MLLQTQESSAVWKEGLIDMSGLESISKQLFGSSSTIPQIPQKKKTQNKSKKGIRLAITPEEIELLKEKAAQTP